MTILWLTAEPTPPRGCSRATASADATARARRWIAEGVGYPRRAVSEELPTLDDPAGTAEGPDRRRAGGRAPRGERGDERCRARRGAARSRRRNTIEWIVVLAGALLIAIVIKTFLFQAFYIPSDSMEPTLHDGDRVLVNKLSYRVHDVNHGDIVVFDRPSTAGETVEGCNGEQVIVPPQQSFNTEEVHDLIKRVIATQGDTVEQRDGAVYVNGQKLDEPYVHKTNGVTDQTPPFRFTSQCIKVPQGDVFVLGDNRGNSNASNSFGPDPGRAPSSAAPSSGCGRRAAHRRSDSRARGVDHAVGVVGVHRVDTEVEQPVEDPDVLGVPAEAQQTEPVEQRREAAGPLAVVQVDRVDTGCRELRGAALGTLLHRAEVGRVDELDVGELVAPCRHLPPVVVAQPQAPRRAVAGGSGDGHRRGRRLRVLHVERQLEVGAALGVQVRQGGDVARQRGPGDLGDLAPPAADPGHAVVVEDGHTVGGDPHVALEPGGAQPASQREGLEGVLGGVGPGAAVGETDGWAAQRGDAGRGHGGLTSRNLGTLGPSMDRATY